MKKEYLKLYLQNTIIIGLFFVLGLYSGYSRRPWIDRVLSISNKEPQIETNADFEPFWKTWAIIDEKYPNNDKIDDQERVWGAISGLVNSMNDPYTVFFPPEDAKEFTEEINGEFSGVGMEVGIKDDILTVIAPLRGTPAERAGIRSGDKILKINDVITTDMSIEKAISLIRGKEGTKVMLTIFHEGESEPVEVSITREKIDIPTIETKVLDNSIYLISLYNFNANSTSLFQEEILKFKSSGKNKLILDLRGNPGGYLDAAVEMTSWFLPAGKIIVKENYGEKAKADDYRSKGYNIFDSNLKMVILIDGGSASASEILAGALSEHGVAKLIGTQTYGKGSVQELIPVTDDTYVKITIAQWLTPKGVSISEKGLTPDVVIKSEKGDKLGVKDTQLDRAIKYINTGK